MEDIFEIGNSFYLIRSPEVDFHRNIYIKIFKKDDKKVILVMDPGSRADIELLTEKMNKLIGGLNKINIIFLSHQDPDVSSIITFIVANNPEVFILASIDTIRLLKSYGIPPKNFKAIEDFKTDSISIKQTGHRIKFIPASYCHFRGAMMLYDYETNILFSGDFLGGVNVNNKKPVYVEKDSFDGVSLFHQIYMPSTKALKNTINRIGLLNPLPEIIAPQHGAVIKGENVVDYLNRLSNLNVGVDLIEETELQTDGFIIALNNFKDRVKELNPAIFAKMINKLRNPGNFTTPLVFSGDNVIQLKMHSSEIIKVYFDLIDEIASEPEKVELKNLLILTFENFGFPVLDKILQNNKKTTTDLFE